MIDSIDANLAAVEAADAAAANGADAQGPCASRSDPR